MKQIFKICTKCKLEKPLSDFSKSSTGKYGHGSVCKDCIKIYYKNYIQNPEKKEKEKIRKKEYNKEYLKKQNVVERRNKYSKDYREKNNCKIKEKEKEYRQKPEVIKHKKEYFSKPEIIDQRKKYKKEYDLKEKNILRKKEYYKDHYSKSEIKEKTKIRKKNYREQNKEKINVQKKDYKNRPHVKIKNNIHRNFLNYFKRNNIEKENKLNVYTGIKYSEYIDHFKNSEYWNDFCNGDNIHIDHIIPCSLYDFNNIDEIKKCWNPKNLRLLQAEENISKGNKLDFKLIEKHNIKHLLPENIKWK